MKLPDRCYGEEKASSYISQVLQALKYMHSKDIIHRDIKPENLLNPHTTTKLSDFGWKMTKKYNQQLIKETVQIVTVYFIWYVIDPCYWANSS